MLTWYFKLDFYRQKIQFKLGKNPAEYFKLENWKNSVQIDREWALFVFDLTKEEVQGPKKTIATRFFELVFIHLNHQIVVINKYRKFILIIISKLLNYYIPDKATLTLYGSVCSSKKPPNIDTEFDKKNPHYKKKNNWQHNL